MTVPWSVVIPSDSEDSLFLSVESLIKAHPGLDLKAIHVVTKKIVPSKFYEKTTVPSVRDSLRKIVFIQDPSDFCFSRRVNLGVAACQGSDVIVMGDDVEVVTPDGFNLLAEEAPLRILAASVKGRIGPWWQKEKENHAEVPFVSFTCVYIPRTVWDAVGPLDEEFPGYGYEDTDYCIRVRREGFSCGVSGRVVIEHSVKIKSSFVSTFKDDLGGMELAAKKAFAEKWRRRLR